MAAQRDAAEAGGGGPGAAPRQPRAGLPPPPLRAAPQAPPSVARSVFALPSDRRSRLALHPQTPVAPAPQLRGTPERRRGLPPALERSPSTALPGRVKHSHISISELLLSAPARMSPDRTATPPGPSPNCHAASAAEPEPLPSEDVEAATDPTQPNMQARPVTAAALPLLARNLLRFTSLCRLSTPAFGGCKDHWPPCEQQDTKSYTKCTKF